MILTGDDVPLHLVARLLDRWELFNAVPEKATRPCAHASRDRVWAYRFLDRLLCDGCFQTAGAVANSLGLVHGFTHECGVPGCDAPAEVVTQVPLPGRGRDRPGEILLLDWWCVGCVEAPPDGREAA